MVQGHVTQRVYISFGLFAKILSITEKPNLLAMSGTKLSEILFILATKAKFGVRSPKFILAIMNSCTQWLTPRKAPLSPHLGS
jgi:hypothetical protein